MKKTALASVIAALFLSACAHQEPFNKESFSAAEKTGRSLKADPVQISAAPRVKSVSQAYVPLSRDTSNTNAWLKSIQVSFTPQTVVPLSEIVKFFARKGVNIVTDLPLDKYSYSGFGMQNVDAESALKMVLTSVGLDYEINSTSKIVTIKPMPVKVWYVNMGNRKANFTSNGGQQASTSQTTTSTSTTSAAMPSGSASVTTTVASTDDFWQSLKSELDSRLKVTIPEYRISSNATSGGSMTAMPITDPMLPPPVSLPGSTGMPQVQPISNGPSLGSSDTGVTYSVKQVGSYSVNPETGAVSVQAPHWILSSLDDYFKRIQDMYNTELTFTGEIISLTTEDKQSAGLDVAAFGKFASGRYGLSYNNNIFGGVTLNFGSGSNIPQTSIGGTSVASSMLGITSDLDGLQLFNAFLSNYGKVNVVQKPVLTTTHGVPGDFRRTVIKYYNTVTQQTASGGTGSAAVGTQNNLVPIELGTSLKINPRIDLSTGLIRAQIVLEQTTQSGVQSIAQSLTAGDNVQQITTQVPILSKIIYTGEALIKDGDLIVMGGQAEDNLVSHDEGITKLKDSALGPLFGARNDEASKNVFYFALKVSTKKRL